ncbi:peptidase M23 [Amylibacter ulvae]|uniref:Peptidase M23 n=1 Tax=Paramylibacter ulvae TaxID=1651968 RepID=A0ABQ3D1E4_9RHOB|nr:peptidoglycan DD-metalloendopeptidase family protein [Amylibacter ulvae]GHA53652.1 peptidase M23 [Amylibacter ulvae]
MSLKTKRFHLSTGIIFASIFALTACDDIKDIRSITDIGRKVDPIPGSNVKKTQSRPQADERGVITYPNYQVIVANRSDTMTDLAARVGISADELARFNGLKVDHMPRDGEVLALPKNADRGVAITPAETGVSGSSVEDIASSALDDVPNSPARIPTGTEPKRHVVKSGETAYTIARLYGVSVTSLASWNGLDKDLSLRTGQQLLVPVEDNSAAVAAAPVQVASNSTATQPAPRPSAVSKPGSGSSAPVPPSSTKSLPKPVPAAKPAEQVVAAAPERKPTTSSRKLLKPVNGKILRGFSSKSGGNEGIDFAANKGSDVKAAENGTVALTSNSVNGSSIILVRHPDNLYTVYSNVSDATVKKGSTVTRGQTIGKVSGGNPPFVHFEVRRGTEAVDPTPYL